jgi:SPP1 family predicted phage head-tail adaptor
MPMKNEFSRYNDGMVSIYREKERRSNFSAKQNVSTMEDMDFVVKLAFEELAKREQDLSFAEQRDFTLSLKVKTRFVKGIDNKCKAVIDGFLYDVKFVDSTRTDIFLYMEGVKKIDS